MFITEKDVTIRQNFEADEIISIKAYVNSILYNLISNAIQYRSPERSLVIDISSYRKDDFVVIEVADNGLGIDLEDSGATYLNYTSVSIRTLKAKAWDFTLLSSR